MTACRLSRSYQANLCWLQLNQTIKSYVMVKIRFIWPFLPCWSGFMRYFFVFIKKTAFEPWQFLTVTSCVYFCMERERYFTADFKQNEAVKIASDSRKTFLWYWFPIPIYFTFQFRIPVSKNASEGHCLWSVLTGLFWQLIYIRCDGGVV